MNKSDFLNSLEDGSGKCWPWPEIEDVYENVLAFKFDPSELDVLYRHCRKAIERRLAKSSPG